jgi:hypothetical protein
VLKEPRAWEALSAARCPAVAQVSSLAGLTGVDLDDRGRLLRRARRGHGRRGRRSSEAAAMAPARAQVRPSSVTTYLVDSRGSPRPVALPVVRGVVRALAAQAIGLWSRLSV